MKALRSIMWFVLFVLMVPAIVEASDNNISTLQIIGAVGSVLILIVVFFSIIMHRHEGFVLAFIILVLIFLASNSFKEHEDLSNQKLTIQGVISDININHTGGGLFSREIKETRENLFHYI